MILEKLRELIRENDTKDKVIVVGLSDYYGAWNELLEEAKTYIPEGIDIGHGIKGMELDGVPIVQSDACITGEYYLIDSADVIKDYLNFKAVIS